MTIVCGVDFSVLARRAAATAAALARKQGDRLLLVHVAARFRLRDPAELQRRTERLEAEAAVVRNGLSVATEIRAGNPAAEIVEAAVTASADMIVVGATRHRLSNHWILGSVSERIAQATPVPLLAVRDHRPLIAWINDNQSIEIVVATDLTPLAMPTFEAVNRLTPIGPTSVILTYVTSQPAEYLRLNIKGPIYHHKAHPIVQEFLTNELAEQAKQIHGALSVRAHFTLSLDEPADELIRTVDEIGADLLVLGAHQRHALARTWYGSRTRRVLHRAAVNALIVPLLPQDQAPVESEALVPATA